MEIAMELLLKIILRYKNIIVYNCQYINPIEKIKSEIISN